MPAYASVAPSGNLGELEQTLRQKIAGFSGTYGVTYVNLATGERFGINDTQEYIAASTSKFPMNVLLWKRIAAGEIDPEMMLEYKPEDLEYGTGIIQNQPYGTAYSVRKTSELSIIHSDNCGINMIIRLLDIEDIRQYLRDLGGVVEYGKRHRSCPADMANVAVDLYKFYRENPEVAGELIAYLENTDWNDRINANLPKDVKVAHKIGNQTRTSNDVGIVFASQPFVLSFMTADTDHGVACANIAALSRIVYDHVEAQP
jgi:beta-lactamase class A